MSSDQSKPIITRRAGTQLPIPGSVASGPTGATAQVERVARALLREYGWGPFHPTRGGDPRGLGGWELIARVALDAADSPASDEQRLSSAKSVLDEPCKCENPDRNSYLYRGDKRWHCEQCDGLMPDQDALREERASER
jgi:hypothetical protein